MIPGRAAAQPPAARPQTPSPLPPAAESLLKISASAPSGSSGPRRRAALPLAGLLALAGLAATGAGGEAEAQQTLSPSTVQATGRLDEAQVREVRGHVQRGLEALAASGDAAAAEEARRGLVGPLTAIGASPVFVQQYGRVLAEGVGALPAETAPAVRVNALLLLRAAPPQEAVPVARPALGAGDAAVRFTAAKVLLDLLRRPADQAPPLNPNDRRQLAGELAAAAATEPDAFVTGKLLPALQAAAGDAGVARLLEVLNRRVALHARSPGSGYLPELTEMSRLFLQNLGSFERAQAEALCTASAGYLKVIAEQLAANAVPADQAEHARGLAAQSDTILRELAASQLRLPARDLPGSVSGALEAGDFAAVSAAADAWAQALGVPVVEVPASPEAPAPAEPAADAAG